MECIEPEVGRLVFRWAMLHGKTQQNPEEKALVDHLNRCAACCYSLPHWRNQAEAAKMMSEAERIVNGKLKAHERVEEKNKEKGRILFKYLTNDPLTGLLIAISADGRITDIRAANRSAFDEA